MKRELMIGIILVWSTGVLAQSSQTITLSQSNASIKDLFKEINRQTGFEFVYDSKTLSTATPVTIDVKNASLEQVLSILFKSQPITYTISGNTIVVKPLEKSESKIPETKSSGLHYVEGRVTDKAGPVPGVNVVIRGTSEGTVTDADGKYTLQANESDLLAFSFIGFKRIETEVGERTIIDVTMEEEVAALNAVTINGGYYETTDELKTGSIVKVTSKDIEKQPVTSPLMALQGRVAGLEITPSSGAPGVAPTIRIRGTNSLRNGGGGPISGNGNLPLYVVDGVPIVSAPVESFITGTSYTGAGYDPLSTMNPANIESIEVLKDGDATAIYGSRGANGVILITTKRKTKALEKTIIDVSTYMGVGKVSKQMKLMNTSQYLMMRKEAFANDKISPSLTNSSAYDLLLWDTTRYTDWQKMLIGGSATISDVQVGVSSGSRNTSFRFNGNYHKETLVFPGDFGYNRMSGQLSVNHTSTNEKFKFSISSMYGFDTHHLFSDGGEMMTNAISLPPNAPNVVQADGNLNWEVHNVNGSNRSTWINPFSYLKLAQENRNLSVINSASISYGILPDLVLSANAGYTTLSSREVQKQPLSALPPESETQSGSASFNNNGRESWIVEPKISYTKKIGLHQMNAVVGGTLQNSTAASTIITGFGYASDAMLGSLNGAGRTSVVKDDFAEYRYSSIYTRLGYNFNDKYLTNLTLRRDGSSRFGPGNKFANFGSLGAAWVFSNEQLIKRALPFLTRGKLRGSYGLTGGDQIGDYNYYSLYRILTDKYVGSTGVFPDKLYNPDFAWEVTKKLEGAIELSFFENRLSAEVGLYRNLSSNQLVFYPLSVITGFGGVLSNFDAVVQNSGWEAVIRGEVLNSNNWNWSISANLTVPSNELVKFDGIEDSPYAHLYRVGAPLSVQLVYTYKGVNPQTGLYEVVDKNNDGIFNDKDKSLVNRAGKIYYGGVSNSIQYKGFDLSFLLQVSHRNMPRFYIVNAVGNSNNQPVDVFNRWRSDGDQSSTQRFSNGQTFQSYNQAMQSDYNSVDASFIRLKTASIGCRVPSKWLEKAHIQEGKIFVQGQNIFTITQYPGLDPETGSSLPPLRILTLGLQLKF